MRFYGIVDTTYKSYRCDDLLPPLEPVFMPAVKLQLSPKQRFDKRRFGFILFHLRDEQGLTQADVAKRAGISRIAWADIEHGKSIPRLDTVAAVAEVLGKTVDELLNFDDRRVFGA